MRSVILKLAIICVSGLYLQCATSSSRDIAHTEKPPTMPGVSESLDIDPEWRIQVTLANVNFKGQWEGSCSKQGDCWFWTSSKLFLYRPEGPTELQVRLHDNQYIVDASPLSNGRGWVVTTAGLFQISNYGANWVYIAVSDFDSQRGRIHAVHFQDDQHGWIAGGVYQRLADRERAPNNALSDDRRQVLVGALARTLDGGLSWERIPLERSIGRFDKVAFSQRIGLISGDAGLQSTTDGGDTWTDVLSGFSRRNLRDRLQVNALFILDERHCWASISGSHLLTTDDGATTWGEIQPPRDLQEEMPPFAEIVFIDERRGLASQNQFGAGQMYKTNDGGQTWTQLKLNTGLSALVVLRKTNQVIAVGGGRFYSFTPVDQERH